MSQVHFILQGKGGVGKTFVSSIFAQFAKKSGKDTLCLDTDPVNASFTGFKSLNVKPIDIMSGNSLDIGKFDNLIEIILATDSNIVIDTGASTFLPLSSYLEDSNAISILMDSGKKVLLHVVLTGGQSQNDSLTGLSGIAKRLGQKAPILIWANEFFGPVIDLEETMIFKENAHKIMSVITIHERQKATFGKDIAQMLERKLTFDEAIGSVDFNTMAKQRIKITRDAIFTQLEGLPL